MAVPQTRIVIPPVAAPQVQASAARNLYPYPTSMVTIVFLTYIKGYLRVFR